MDWWKSVTGAFWPRKREARLDGRDDGPETGSAPKLEPILRVEAPGLGKPEARYGDQLMRRRWVEAQLEERGIPYFPGMPYSPSQAEVKVRTVQEVADRFVALMVVSITAEGLERDEIDGLIKDYGAQDLLTPQEAAFIADPAPSQHDRTQFVWRYEAAWVLAWALNLVDSDLYFPDRITDVPMLARTFLGAENPAAKGLRDTNHILNELDRTYLYHWATRDARIKGNKVPGGLNGGVVMERHHALNWLTCYNDSVWDEVSTDT